MGILSGKATLMLSFLSPFSVGLTLIDNTCSSSKTLVPLQTELQIRGGIADNSKINFLFFNENICCDPSLEPS